MKRILIVDDNQTLANVYRGKLTSAGYAVEVAHDGESGIAAARKTPPDLVLLDLMMPKMSGAEVLAALRADERLSAVPVFVLSNSYTAARTEELWKAGATQVLTKASSSPNSLLDAIRSALASE